MTKSIDHRLAFERTPILTGLFVGFLMAIYIAVLPLS